ncbi:MAG TPA: hypothetical protein PLB05_11490, partial [Candidatus Omnitrophota bacterium]|nr:hypothetical protein [Candidatus Omnitrophota bacterium]
MKSGWIVHKNKRILYADYRGFPADSEEQKAEIAHVNELACREPRGTVLLLVNVEGSTGTKDAISSLKESAVKVKHSVVKTAVVGVTGFKSILMNIIVNYSGLSMVTFKD